MATIKPFAALRPRPETAGRICELPYDVMSSDEAQQVALGNPLSFLHVSKPEIDLPPGTDVHAAEVYAKGGENFRSLMAQGQLVQDGQPCFYLYRQVMGQHAQTGIVAGASCADYRNNIIRKHELTRPDKEDDRVKHIEALNAQTGPAFLVYRSQPAIDAFVLARSAQPPAIDFTAKDGVRHTSWLISDAEGIEFLASAFASVPRLYIADGHHRSAAAARVCDARHGAGPSSGFLSVIFAHHHTQILPYHRVLKDLNGRTPAAILEELDGVFIIHRNTNRQPARKHELGLYLDGHWHSLNFRPRFAATTDPIEKLDVTLLQKYVLAPLFGIDDPRRSQRIDFVGGIRGPGELERLVNAGHHACAFSLYPTSIDDLMTIADAEGIMPPKSTWFEPKLRDGMFSYLL